MKKSVKSKPRQVKRKPPEPGAQRREIAELRERIEALTVEVASLRAIVAPSSGGSVHLVNGLIDPPGPDWGA
jgi:hypothetical protein